MYQKIIEKYLDKTGHLGKYEPRQIEAFMRVEHPTLDGLSPDQFDMEVRIARHCIDGCGPAEAERLAETYGLGATGYGQSKEKG
jgi:hypothetical protein